LETLNETKARKKGAEHMKIVGCDLHTRYQQIAMLDKETGELIERKRGAFYAGSIRPMMRLAYWRRSTCNPFVSFPLLSRYFGAIRGPACC
jgi:hypothetical protein